MPIPAGSEATTVNAETIALALGRTAPASDSPEYAQWEMWIADALMLIGDRLGDPAELDQPRLNYVVREAVAAHVRRPDDATQVDIAVDDGRSSRRYTSSRGRVTILDEWWALLSPASDSGVGFSTRPTFEPDTVTEDSWA